MWLLYVQTLWDTADKYAGAAVGQVVGKRVAGSGNVWKTKKNRHFRKGSRAMSPPWTRSSASLRTDTSLGEPLWSICPSTHCKHRGAAVLTHTQGCHIIKTKRESDDASKGQLNQGNRTRTVLKIGWENQINVHNYLSNLFSFSFDRTIGKKSRHCQFDWVCATHIKDRSLVLKNVRSTGMWN